MGKAFTRKYRGDGYIKRPYRHYFGNSMYVKERGAFYHHLSQNGRYGDGVLRAYNILYGSIRFFEVLS